MVIAASALFYCSEGRCVGLAVNEYAHITVAPAMRAAGHQLHFASSFMQSAGEAALASARARYGGKGDDEDDEEAVDVNGGVVSGLSSAAVLRSRLAAARDKAVRPPGLHARYRMVDLASARGCFVSPRRLLLSLSDGRLCVLRLLPPPSTSATTSATNNRTRRSSGSSNRRGGGGGGGESDATGYGSRARSLPRRREGVNKLELRWTAHR